MLKVENISNVRIHTDEWRAARLGKFTSSMIYTLMGDKPFTQGAMTYIYERVGEEISGAASKYEISTDATNWGLLHENDNLRKFGEFRGVDFLVTQVLITDPNSRFGSTPDAIIPIKKHGDTWEVETVEAKCFPSYGHYIECALCNTPQELKKVDKAIFWQCVDQIDNCDSMKGWASFMHPEFKVGGFKAIPFRKIELIEDFKLLKERKHLAELKFDEIRNKLINLKN
jgi:hypothetical protein